MLVMKRLALVLIAGLLLLPARPLPLIAAEAAVLTPDGERVVRHHHRHAERRPYLGCPDHYSCYPLYGAYGPYGGQAYWAAYTGWYR
jgi:hypothetical protein